jgi:alkylation response protein AidB-like acyl-CoA dehydrogenase
LSAALTIEAPRGEGRRFKIALCILDHTGITIAAQALGIAQEGFDYALGCIRERKQSGHPIVEFQACGS